MLKKSISLILCLVMCLSVFTMTATSTFAAYNFKTIFSVKGESIVGDLLTYTISITKNQENIAGVIINADFDNSVLEPVTNNCGPVGKTIDGNFVENFKGSYVSGVNKNNPGVYIIAYTNDVAVSTTATTGFYKLQFRVIDKSRPSTDIKFYCKEYYSTTETNKNFVAVSNEERQIIADYSEVSTLAKPVLKGVEPNVKGLEVSWNGVEGAKGYQVKRKSNDADSVDWLDVATVGASQTSFIDENLVSGKTYTYTVIAFNDYGAGLYDIEGVSRKYIEKPVISSVENVVGGIRVNWNSTEGADFYLIYRRSSGDEGWVQLAKRNSNLGTSYIDESVVNGESYEYDIVSATDTYASPNADKGETVTYVSAPVIIGAENTLDGIMLSWSAQPGATHYVLYRRNKSTQDQLIVHKDSIRGTSYLDENVSAGKVYVYSVKACTNQGDSAYDPNGYTIARIEPTEVTSLELEKNGVRVTWRPVEDVSGYRIYHRSASGGSWTEAGYVAKGVTSFVDQKLKSGADYCFAVCPVFSESESAKMESEPIYFIATPADVKAENVNEGIKLTWKASTGAMKYIVMRSDGGSDYERVAEIDPDGALEFIDTNVSWNEVYTYTVQAVSLKGESLISNVSEPLRRIGAIGRATPKLCDGGIKVTWDAVKDVDAYAVFRNTGSGWVQVNKVTKNEYVDKNVKSAVAYSYAVAAVVDGSRGVLNTDNPKTITYIAPVASATATNGANYTKITWKAVEGAVNYEICRTTNADLSGLTSLKLVKASELSYIDNSVKSGKTYYYVLRAKNSERYSMYSKPVKNTFLSAPVIKSLARTYTGVSFSWNRVAGAEGYRVYSKVGNGSWVYLKTVGADTLSYTDTKAQNGKRMYYTVRAESKTGISVYDAKSIVYIAAPKITTSNVTKGIQLKWNKNSVVDNYKIYRKAKSTDAWSYIATVEGTTYLDTTAKPGVTYRYTIRANSDGVYSSYNNSGWAVRRLTNPTLKSADNGYGYISVKWAKVTGATGYRVYRKANGASSWTYLGSVTTNTYKDKAVKNQYDYTYTVRAYYGTSLSSFNSKGVSVRYITAPKLTVVNRTGNVTLAWDAVSGASSYYVYRKAGNATSWTKIATVSKPGYIDKKVSNKITYTYTIKAYGSKKTSGYNSTGWKVLYLDTPDMLSVQSTRNGITFKWAPVKGCTSYSVFRKEGSGPWVQIGSVSSKTTSYTDKKVEMGVKYTYTVRAKYGNSLSWFESDLSCIQKY